MQSISARRPSTTLNATFIIRVESVDHFSETMNKLVRLVGCLCYFQHGSCQTHGDDAHIHRKYNNYRLCNNISPLSGTKIHMLLTVL